MLLLSATVENPMKYGRFYLNFNDFVPNALLHGTLQLIGYMSQLIYTNILMTINYLQF